jgi:adenylate cyclase
MLGRFSDADERLAKLFQGDPADAEPLHQGIPHHFAVELAWFRNDTSAATRHANRVAHFAHQAANPYWFVLASFCQGLAASTAGDFVEADGFFQQALDASRRGRAGLEYEARILAFQADNLMRAGDLRRAGELAAEAIGVAQRKADRLAECHASLVAADVYLRRSGSQHTEEARRLLNRANALIDETGAKVYEPMMLRVRAEAGDKKGLAASRPS